MAGCSVLRCESKQKRKNPYISFHQFPKDKETLKKWSAATGRKNWEPKKHSCICSIHFEEDCFLRFKRATCLKKLAVPTLFLYDPSRNDSSVSDNNMNSDDFDYPVGNKHKDRFDETIKPESNSGELTNLEIPYPGNSYVVLTNRPTGRPESIEDGIKIKDKGSTNLKVCRVCLAVDCKMFQLNGKLKQAYTQVIGIHVSSHDGLPQLLCWECASRVSSAVKLCNRAIKAHTILSSLLALSGSINMQDIRSVDRRQMELMTSLKCDIFKDTHHQNIIDIIEVVKSYKSDENTQAFGNEFDDNDDDEMYENEVDEDDDDDIYKSDVDKDDDDDNYKSDVDKDVDYDDDKYKSDVDKDDDDDKYKSDVDKDDDDDDNYKSDVDKDDDDDKYKSDVDKDDDDDDNYKSGVDKYDDDDKYKSKGDQHDNDDEIDTSDQEMEKNDSNMEDVEPVNGSHNKSSVLSKLEKFFTITAVKLGDAIAAVQSRKQAEAFIDAPFKCAICYRGYNIKHRYEIHAIKHTEIFGNIECPVCKFRYKSERRLSAHMRFQHLSKYNCKRCAFVTDSRTMASNHRQIHAGEVYKCPHCPKLLKHMTSYYSHIRFRHACSFTCELCGHTFLSAFGVRQHKRKQHKLDGLSIDGPFCETCDITFATRKAYDTHLLMSSRHNNDNRLSQVNLYQTSRRKVDSSGRRQEPRQRRKPTTRPVTCEKCGVTLDSRYSYAHHFRNVHPSEIRTQHFTKWNGDNPVVCDQCGKTFSCLAKLNSHMPVHTGERFKCDDCGKTFMGKQNLQQHRKLHEPSRTTYSCELCGKRFGFSGNLKRHILLHANAAPFECEMCGKRLTTRAGLQAHIDHVHSGRPWPKRVRLRRRS